jgi:hypothetical protein
VNTIVRRSERVVGNSELGGAWNLALLPVV